MLGIDVEHGRVRRVRTTQGDIEAERVVIACGAWSPRIAQMAGASIPLTPMVHQMIDIGPAPRFANTTGMIEYPIVRDMDTNMYERQEGTGLEIGSYAHRPITLDADEIPSIEESALTPTELPFTQEDFDPQMEIALELMPEIVGDESRRREVRDQRRAVGDLRRDAAARRDARGPRAVVGGGDLDQGGARRRQDRRRADGPRRVRDRRLRVEHRPRLPAPADQDPHRRPRRREGFNKMYGIVHPAEQWESNRGVRLSPFYEHEKRLERRLLRDRRLGAPALV